MPSANPPVVMTPAFLKAVEAIVGRRFLLTQPEVLTTYECDASTFIKSAPGAVALPRTTDQVAALVKTCRSYNVPYVARGAGTGMSGGAIARPDALIIGLTRMNAILKLDHRLHVAQVECGVVNAWLTMAAEPMGLFYGPDPSSQSACTLGGNVAENAGGIHCLKYGVTVDHVLGLKWVTPAGEVVSLGGMHRRTLGYNLTGLLVGSEGTLGIVTEVTVRLLLKPQHICVWLAAFQHVEQATRLVSDLIASGLTPSALEFMDATTVQAVNASFNVGFPEDCQAVLLIEYDGTSATLQYAHTRLNALLEEHGCQQVRMAKNETERQQLWAARKGAVAAYGRLTPAFYLHDCVIPRSRLTEALTGIQTIGQTHQVRIASVFHAGDGNLHPHILYDPAQTEQLARVKTAGDAIIRLCIDLGGTLSGEHGIGLEKSAYMDQVFNETDLAWMRQLKQTFDPEGLANPDKILPLRRSCGEVGVVDNLAAHPVIQAGQAWV